VSRQRLDVSRLAAEVIEQLRAQEPARDVTCTIQPDIIVDADARLVHILLENLIGNAWKFTSKTPNATIEVRAQTQAEGFVLSVSDNGAGFDMAFASKLFGPFQRLHRRDEFPGTGIGLATVQRIVHRHGGRVWAEATVNCGATFHLTLLPANRPDRTDADLQAAIQAAVKVAPTKAG
jgi:light-regulated signal transduction histidine kinase (bacteriophytochrome)